MCAVQSGTRRGRQYYLRAERGRADLCVLAGSTRYVVRARGQREREPRRRAVLVQLVRGAVAGGHHGHTDVALIEEVEKPPHHHRVSDIRHLEFVEAQHPA